MRSDSITRVLAGIVAVVLSFGAAGDAAAQTRYELPPKAIVDILDAKPLPTVAVSPSRQQIALLERASMPTIADLSQPMLRLAGARINPKTTGPQRPPSIIGLSLTRIADAKTVKVPLPPGAKIEWIGFSPDSRRVAFTETRASGIVLWVADATTGAAKPLTQPTLNGTIGSACAWVNAASLLCRVVPALRGLPPKPSPVPAGPNVQENAGSAAPVSTYEDLLKNAHDEALFEYLLHEPTGAGERRHGRTDASRQAGRLRHRQRVAERGVPPGLQARAAFFASGSVLGLCKKGGGVEPGGGAGADDCRSAVE